MHKKWYIDRSTCNSLSFCYFIFLFIYWKRFGYKISSNITKHAWRKSWTTEEAHHYAISHMKKKVLERWGVLPIRLPSHYFILQVMVRHQIKKIVPWVVYKDMHGLYSCILLALINQSSYSQQPIMQKFCALLPMCWPINFVLTSGPCAHAAY